MRQSRTAWSCVAAMVLALTAACTASPSGSHGGTFDGALTGIENSSTHPGGTLRLAMSADWDSPDPGNTYSVSAWNFGRVYARSLVAYANKPGKAGLTLVPDLATSLGTPSDGARTWTFHIRRGARFSNGAAITSADVKYAIERSNWGHAVLPNGPTYFLNLIDPNPAHPWPGPYVDKGGSLPDSEIATPDPYTIVFHLTQPFADFNYLATAPQTAPVPRQDDTGASYQNHIVSSGPYTVDSFQTGVGMTLSPNRYWNPATDPEHLHPQLAKKIVVRTKVDPNTVDDESMSGEINAALGFTGMQPAGQTKVLTTPGLKNSADDPDTGLLYYAGISTKVAPFTNLSCRRAVEYAADKAELLNQYGGSVAGQTATTILPPTVEPVPQQRRQGRRGQGPLSHRDLPRATR